MAFKIYTRTGDKGKTGLIGGTKVSKSDLRIEAYGTVDELNSYIGLIKDIISLDDTISILKEVQDRLFTIGSSLACDPEKELQLRIPDLHDTDVKFLETEIDRMNEVLPEMKHFILPGGHSTVSHIHIARCICRRAERCCVRLADHEEHVEPKIIIYLNRLSDYLFMLSRYAGHQMHVQEIPWTPRIY